MYCFFVENMLQWYRTNRATGVFPVALTTFAE